MAFTSNIDTVLKQMGGIEKDITEEVRHIVHQTIVRIDTGVHDKTPVWSGLAVRNMIWSRDEPNGKEFKEIESGNVEDGSRRAANQSAAQSTLKNVLVKNPYGVFYLSNASKHIVELEAGQLPSPERSRVPSGGMFGLTFAEVRSTIGKGGR